MARATVEGAPPRSSRIYPAGRRAWPVERPDWGPVGERWRDAMVSRSVTGVATEGDLGEVRVERDVPGLASADAAALVADVLADEGGRVRRRPAARVRRAALRAARQPGTTAGRAR